MEVNHLCLVCQGLSESNLSFQPWRYFMEITKGFVHAGIQVTIFSDTGSSVSGIRFVRLPSRGFSRLTWIRTVSKVVQELKPGLAIWNLGVTSFIQPGWIANYDVPTIGLFSSPMYTLHELLRIPLARLVSGLNLSLAHGMGSLIPRSWLIGNMKKAPIKHWVTQTQTLKDQLAPLGISPSEISLIRPGVDQEWVRQLSYTRRSLKEFLRFDAEDIVLVYFGSPAPLRGLPLLIEAFSLARREIKRLRLLILSRSNREEGEAKRKVIASQFSNDIHWVSGWMSAKDLAEYVGSSEIVALPFELVPSDAPLSILEARALGKPVITCRLSCLPELAGDSRTYIAESSDRESLAQKILIAVGDLRVGMNSTPIYERLWNEMVNDWFRLVHSL